MAGEHERMLPGRYRVLVTELTAWGSSVEPRTTGVLPVVPQAQEVLAIERLLTMLVISFARAISAEMCTRRILAGWWLDSVFVQAGLVGKGTSARFKKGVLITAIVRGVTERMCETLYAWSSHFLRTVTHGAHFFECPIFQPAPILVIGGGMKNSSGPHVFIFYK